MHNDYTDDDLIQYIYNELGPEAFERIENELKGNYELKKDFDFYNKLVRHLDRLYEDPSQSTVDMIMEYSRKKSGMKTSH